MSKILDWDKYKKLIREAGVEGSVLIENDDILPIAKAEKVSVFGRMQFHYYKSGTGSGGLVNTPYEISIIDALKENKDILINEELFDIYRLWEQKNPFDYGKGWAREPWAQNEMPLDDKVVKDASEKSDVAIVIISRTAGEDKDNTKDKGSYLLTETENDMIDKTCRYFRKVVVVLNVGNIIDMSFIDIYKPGAVLYVWQAGMEGAYAISDIISGIQIPSGKLTNTIAKKADYYPSTKNFGNKYENVFMEDIFVGYRYFETFAKDKVRYPFGYGLSYTNFKIEKENAIKKADSIDIKIKVINNGNYKGKEVIQIYSSMPFGNISKASRNLIAYKKTKMLNIGEEEIIDFKISIKEFSSFCEKTNSYVLEEGEYQIFFGNNVRDAKLCFSFNIDKYTIIEKLSEALAPKKTFKRMSRDKNGKLIYEDVVLRRVNLEERIKSEKPIFKSYNLDKKYLLEDVKNNKITMDLFLSQLSDEELIILTRGEGMNSPKVTPGTAGAFGGLTNSLKRYGIPAVCCSDGPSGIRMDCGTKAFSLPNGTLLACSFNDNLIEELYYMLGLELRRNNIDILLGPGMNIHRSPLCGRNFEYFSEDPFLTGKIAAANIIGLNKAGVAGTLKHFICNSQEYNKHYHNSVISQRAIREIYLKPYKIAIEESDVICIMSSYSAVNSIWAASNYDLLTVVLRNEWGYKGIVMTDWWSNLAGEDESPDKRNTASMIKAQNDLYMVVFNAEENSNQDNTKEALESGVIDRNQLLRAAKNICNTIIKLPVMKKEENIKSINFNEMDKNTDYRNMDIFVVDRNLEIKVDKTNLNENNEYPFLVSYKNKGKYKISVKEINSKIYINNKILDVKDEGYYYIDFITNFNKRIKFEESLKTSTSILIDIVEEYSDE